MNQKKSSTNPQRPRSKLVRYSGLGMQLMFICLALIAAGYGLDAYMGLENRFILVSVFLSVFAVIYLIIKKLSA